MMTERNWAVFSIALIALIAAAILMLVKMTLNRPPGKSEQDEARIACGKAGVKSFSWDVVDVHGSTYEHPKFVCK